MRKCLHCSGQIIKENKTGVCRACFPKHGIARLQEMDPDYKAKHSAKIRRHYQIHPERRAEIAKSVSRYANRPEVRKARSERAKAIGLQAMGNAAQPAGSEPRRRAGINCSNTKLAWCPHDLRDEYRHLLRNKGFSAEEAREVILATDRARLERIHGGAS